MLEIGKANEVKFKVGVNGTKAEPTVRIVIGMNERELGFKAEKLLGGGPEDWFSEVKIPEDMAAGEYDFRVEVIVNNRLFTPVKRRVTVGSIDALAAFATEAQGEQQAPSEPVPPPEPGTPPPQPVPPKPIVPPPAPTGLMKEAAAKDDTVAHRPAKKREQKKTSVAEAEFQAFLKQRNPAKHEPKPVRISIADIAAESEKRFDKVLKESASYTPPAATVKPINIQHHIPVTLTKGDIIYE